MTFEDNKEKGRAGISIAIAYFGVNGYTVSIPMNDTQWYDQVVEKDGVFQSVQCKFTNTKDKKISLRSCGGTNGKVYDNIRNHDVDIQFCSDSEMNMFLIPMKDLMKAGNVNSISLRTSKTLNGQGFQTHTYLVRF